MGIQLEQILKSLRNEEWLDLTGNAVEGLDRNLFQIARHLQSSLANKLKMLMISLNDAAIQLLDNFIVNKATSLD